jgi:lipoprotein-anchoring transpeptidase ErfK/SrfK
MMLRCRHKLWLYFALCLSLASSITPAKLEARTTIVNNVDGAIDDYLAQSRTTTKKSAPRDPNNLDLPPEPTPKNPTPKAKTLPKGSTIITVGPPKTTNQPTTRETSKIKPSIPAVSEKVPSAPPVIDESKGKPATPRPTTATPSSPSAANPYATGETISLVIELGKKQVTVFKGDKLITKYPIAIGKPGWETPVGEWKVMELIRNPGWTNFKTGEIMAPGPENPLGERWIGFWSDGKDSISTVPPI